MCTPDWLGYLAGGFVGFLVSLIVIVLLVGVYQLGVESGRLKR